MRLLFSCASLVITACACRGGAFGASLQSGIGYDYQSGPNGQDWRGALGFLSCETHGGDLTVAAVRFEDSNVGAGFSGLANAGVPFLSRARLRVIGVRSIGDGSYRSSRVRFGPEIAVMGRWSLGIYYLHFEDNASSRLNSMGSEMGFPIAPTLTGSGGVSYGTWQTGLTSLQGNAGLAWSPVHRIQVLGEMTLGRNVVAFSETSPAGGGLVRLPVLGEFGAGNSRGVTKTTRQDEIAATAIVGLRFLIP